MAATLGVPYDELGPLKLALAEAARTDEANAAQAVSRFVEIRPGVVDTLRAKRHHLITGRRGTGKSTLLHVVRKRLRDHGVPVAVIDMENYKGRPFPDVLIEILVALFDEAKPQVRIKTFVSDIALRRKFRRTRRELRALLADPQSLIKNVTRAQEKSRRGRRAVGASAQVATNGANAGVVVGHDVSSRTSASATATAQFEEFKIERLQQIASRLSRELSAIVAGATSKQAVVFVDDYYFVRLDDQPDVLNYLQQVVKNTGVWLKVGGVGARMRPFREADPPVGMQPDQDIDRVTIDVTLDDFGTAQRFLEKMLDGVLEPLSLTTARLLTDTARSRMVLACGGAVARDYVTLTAAALDAAIERLNRGAAPTSETEVSIQAEDVNVAARQRKNRKEEDELDQDAGADAVRLKDRWRDVCDFVREQGNIAFVLFRQKDLDESPWGDEVRQLENLRLLHRIRDTVPNSPNWRGVKTMVYMVDLGQVAGQRLRTGIPSFWQSTNEFDKLRRAEWVYGPDWRARLKEKRARPAKPPTQSGTTRPAAPIPDAADNALTLFENPADLDVDA